MKCKEIQEKEKMLNKKKVEKLKEKGITLIALVVTIIILLILAGVTLNMAMSGDGLFSRARDAADKYKKAQEDEAELISEIGKEMNSEYVGAFVTGYEPTEGTCTITESQSGTDTSQTFTTKAEGEIKWRIWDYDGTTLRIILDKPTTQRLALKGAIGYNNGVWVINEICRQCFGNKEMNGVKVYNLKRSDIQKVSTYDYKMYSHDDIWIESENGKGSIKFGSTKKYVDAETVMYPKMWENSDKNWKYENKGEEECIDWESEEKIEDGSDEASEGNPDETEFRQSFYAHYYSDENKEFKNEKYYDMIFAGAVQGDYFYWLSGRCVLLGNTICRFCIQSIDTKSGNNLISGDTLYHSSRKST